MLVVLGFSDLYDPDLWLVPGSSLGVLSCPMVVFV